MLTIREIIKTLYNALLQRLKKHRGNWEQNDPTADDYIKNRPFYTDETKTETVVKTTNFTATSSYWWGSPFAFIPVVGETYRVIFDGKEYICAGKIADWGGKYIGNAAIDWDGLDTGEPFFYFWYDNYDYGMCVRYAGKHTITIEKIKIVKIDERYLPENNNEEIEMAIDDLYDFADYISDEIQNTVSYTQSQNLSTVQKQTARTNIGAAATSDLAAVANSGNYNDLSNKPCSKITTNNGWNYLEFESSYTSPSGTIFKKHSLTDTRWNMESPYAWQLKVTGNTLVSTNYTIGKKLDEYHYVWGNASLYDSSYENTGEIWCIVVFVGTHSTYIYWYHPSLPACYYSRQTTTITQLSEELIPDTIARVAELPQSDWSVNDATDVQYIQNRTHSEELILGEEIYNSYGGSLSETNVGHIASLQTVMSAGSEIVCSINDVQFVGVPQYYEHRNAAIQILSYWYIGNLNLYESFLPNTGENYALIVHKISTQPTTYTSIVTYVNGTQTTSSDTVVVKYPDTTIVHQLDEKFIPDTIARTEDIPTVVQPDWNQNDPNAADYVKNRTHFYGRGLVPIIQANGGGKDYGVGLMEYRGVLPVGEFELFEEGVTYTISCNGVSDTIVGTSSTILSAAASELPNISANTNITLFAVNAYGSTRDYHIRVEGGNSDDVWTVAKESDVIVPLDEKFIPDTIARTEDIPTVVQPDWNQNDPTAPDYIKNKTHYENIVYNTYRKILTLKNVPATAANIDRRVGSSFSERDIGSVFIVIFDGTKYVCVLEQVPVEPVTGTDSLAGQEQIRFALGDKTFEKFPFYYYQRNYSAYRICVPDDGLSHNIELWSSQEIKTLVQLDEKYIPDTIARVEQVPIIDETLTIAQKAADSKVVGDKINDINSSLSMQIVSSKNYISLIDQISGLPYMISIQDGNLVSEIGVESIEVTTPPIVSEYVHGENIDTTGMVVTAIRFDGTTKDVTNEVKVGYAMEGQGAKITYTQAGIDIIAYAPVSVASFDADRILVDFEYINNNDGTYTITGWKGTYNGEPSTEIIIPDYGCIIL